MYPHSFDLRPKLVIEMRFSDDEDEVPLPASNPVQAPKQDADSGEGSDSGIDEAIGGTDGDVSEGAAVHAVDEAGGGAADGDADALGAVGGSVEGEDAEDASGGPTEKAGSSQGDQSNVGEQVISPVLLPMVLELVFQEMPVLDLHLCRQVSKLWYREATRTLGMRLKIDINEETCIHSILLKMEQQTRIRISEINTYNINLNTPEFQQLFRKSHPTLAVFRVTDGQCTSTNWQRMLRRSPNLVLLETGALKDGENHLKLFPIMRYPNEEMQFHYLRYLEFLSYGSPPSVFLSDVARACPNLKKLIAYNFPEENPKNFEGLELPFLEVFYIPQLSGLVDAHVECLLKLKLSLRELMFNNFDSELSPTLIQTFIESQSHSLKSLLMTQSKSEHEPFTDQNPSCPFPFKLANLTYLEVEKPFVRNMSHVISYEAFPELCHLYLRFNPGTNWGRCMPKNLRIHPGVHHMTVQWIEEKPLAQMAKALPNLKALDLMYCDDSILRVIFTYLPLLEVLNVEDSEYRKITDEGLTGLPDGITDESKRKWPYIGNLKKLHLLSLEFKFHPVSDKSILQGIVDASSLKVLRISGLQISKEVADVISNKLIHLKTHCMHLGHCGEHETGSVPEEGAADGEVAGPSPKVAAENAEQA